MNLPYKAKTGKDVERMKKAYHQEYLLNCEYDQVQLNDYIYMDKKDAEEIQDYPLGYNLFDLKQPFRRKILVPIQSYSNIGDICVYY